jgi:DNA repair protein RadC
MTNADRLREAAASYLNLDQLRILASTPSNVWDAIRTDVIPDELRDLLTLLQNLLTPPMSTTISSPSAVAAMLMAEAATIQHERLWVICLNKKNQVISIDRLYDGCLDTSPVRAAEVYRKALQINAACIILAHNHPSGDPTPSPDDIAITKQLIQAGALLDIDLMDHLIIGHARWCSMRERRLGW